MNADQSQKDADSVEDMLQVVVASGRHEGASVEFQRPLLQNVLIGSHLDCDLVVSDEGVAASHALVFEQGGCLWIKAVPGSGETRANGHLVTQLGARLERDMLLKLGSSASLKVNGPSLPGLRQAETKAADVSKPFRRPLGRVRAFAAIACVACSATLAALALGVSDRPGNVSASINASATPEKAAKSSDLAGLAALELVARQIDRYLADPGVKVTAKHPNRIEVAGIARSAATQGQLKKIQIVLPKGVEISSTVSYPEGEVNKAVVPVNDQQLSKLAKKVLQVASSEKSPYLEIEGGMRVFEGGQLNGYELLKITPVVIVARRDNQIETFKVE